MTPSAMTSTATALATILKAVGFILTAMRGLAWKELAMVRVENQTASQGDPGLLTRGVLFMNRRQSGGVGRDR